MVVRDTAVASRSDTIRSSLGISGLIGMRERAELLDAELTIESDSETGTAITSEVPARNAYV